MWVVKPTCASTQTIDRRFGRALVCGVIVAALLGPLGSVAQASPPPPSFSPEIELLAGTFPRSVALGDLNDDGAPDLVVANHGWLDVGPGVIGSVSVSLGDGAGGFGARTDYELGAEVKAVALGDLDGDTFLDLIVTANGGGIGKLWVLLGDGAGGFGPKAETVAANSMGPGSLAVADLNGDTIPDVAVADSESVNVLFGSGTGGFAGDPEWPVLETPTGTLPNSVGAGHLNGDTFLDLVSTNWEGSVSVLLGNGDGTFVLGSELAVGSSPRSVAVGDLNGDGRSDMAVANFDGDSVSVLLGNGDGTFLPSRDFATGTSPVSVVMAHINGDARADLAVANFDGDSVSVLVGDGAGGFTVPVGVAAGWGPRAVAAGDLNGDGLPDLTVANAMSDNPDPGLGDPNPGPGTVSVLLNTSPRAPGAPTIIRNATAGDGQATVSWAAPAADGGSAITGYVVTPYVGYGPRPSTAFASTGTTQTITGLTNGTEYRFRVQAVNAVGTSGFSTVTNPVAPMAPTAPGAPTIIRNATAGDGEATVSWTAPASDGGSPITGYVVTPYVGYGPRLSTTFTSTATTQTVTGLVNGTEYRFRVQAINAVGTSGYSTVTNPVTPSA